MRFSKEEIVSWPSNFKKCSKCLKIKDLNSFTKNNKLLFGVSSICRKCKTNSSYRPSKKWTREEISSWPLKHKACVSCKEIKSFDFFHKNDNGQIFGLASDCKECRKVITKDAWIYKVNTNLEKIIYDRARSRANRKKIDFNIDLSDIVIPKKCPVLNKPLIYGDHDWSPSIDRIVPSLGYIKGNIMIISNRANVIKNNASPEELLKIAKFYTQILSLDNYSV
jgi:hypothetical protein